MPLPHLNIYRHDRRTRTLITLAGEIDLETVPLMRATFERCLRDGVRIIDVDLTPVTFCDCSGLNTIIEAYLHSTAAGGTLRLHYPPPMLARMIDLSGCGFMLMGLPAVPGPTPLQSPLSAAPAPLPAACFEAVHQLAPTVSGGAL
ncbi:STAS domain-containing protein [Streptomyces sp. BA2]|uniref:STAS domain-containing protein n=1 Tax=Streptomyces sp. BA2 TaxID=436595 RepID=UPI00132C8E9B|nr:STAS domain-containing protein [Streptomyces sp. BA2]MWA08257.1 STAS domain-containing protein [Streptomyces sp. BA2]